LSIKTRLILAALTGGFLLAAVSGAYLTGRNHEKQKWENKTLKEEKATNEQNNAIEKEQKKILLTPRSSGVIDGCLRRACA
jgi:hypothetical protein